MTASCIQQLVLFHFDRTSFALAPAAAKQLEMGATQNVNCCENSDEKHSVEAINKAIQK